MQNRRIGEGSRSALEGACGVADHFVEGRHSGSGQASPRHGGEVESIWRPLPHRWQPFGVLKLRLEQAQPKASKGGGDRSVRGLDRRKREREENALRCSTRWGQSGSGVVKHSNPRSRWMQFRRVTPGCGKPTSGTMNREEAGYGCSLTECWVAVIGRTHLDREPRRAARRTAGHDLAGRKSSQSKSVSGTPSGH